MPVFIAKNFTGFYPVGVAAVIVAPNAATAALRLNIELRQSRKLPGDQEAVDLIEVDPNQEQVIIVRDGDY